MNTTYDVRIYEVEKRPLSSKGSKARYSYRVRWKVARKRWQETFYNSTLAKNFRSALMAAASRGEAFYVDTGRPVSMAREARAMSWYEFACAFVDMKWPWVAATTRRTHAEAMTAVTTLMFKDSKGKPDDKLIRRALTQWGFNTARRDSPDCPSEVQAALRWVEAHTRQVASLADVEVLRPVLDGLSLKLDGAQGASSVVGRRRRILNTAMEYAVTELKLLEANPMPQIKRAATKSKAVQAVDRRSVANPVQARTLLNAVRDQKPSGPRLVAFFGCLYFAALRPEEAAALSKQNLSLPDEGWGELHLETARPYAGKQWTNNGGSRDERGLKQRPKEEVRPVPCPPELTALLHEHIRRFGTTADGRLFVGERNEDELPKLTIVRSWQRAREAVFTEDVLASPLAKTPYDLRHAAVSTWLNGGVAATTVAEWAGHSLEVLLKTYAKCMDGEMASAQRRVQAALGH